MITSYVVILNEVKNLPDYLEILQRKRFRMTNRK